MLDFNRLEEMLFKAGDVLKDGSLDALSLNPGGWGGNSIMTTTKYIPRIMKYFGLEYKLHTVDSVIKKVAGYFGKDVELPIFGTHKTMEGLGLSLIGGGLAGLVWYYVPYVADHFGKDHISYTLYNMGAGFLAAMGDLVGSFYKRRKDIPEGDFAPNIDSLPWMGLYPILYYGLKWNDLKTGGLYKSLARVLTSYGVTLGVGKYAHYKMNRMAGTIKEEDEKGFEENSLYLPPNHIYNYGIQ